MHEHPRVGGLEPERPEALVGDGEAEREGERADESVGVTEPRGHVVRPRELSVDAHREQHLHRREHHHRSGEPDLQLDRAVKKSVYGASRVGSCVLP